MQSFLPAKAVSLLFLSAGLVVGLNLANPTPAHAVEMRVSRDALERTLRQQLFAGPNGRK